jgi:MoaA/NifB/PqqE/SkfB family radical SAM enzyme
MPSPPSAPYRPVSRRLEDARVLGKMMRSRLAARPLFLSHLVTARCNGRCAHCLWRSAGPEDLQATATELTTEEISWLYRRAAEAGVCHLALWGGEPLLRKDIVQICQAASGAGLSVTLMTNGWLLPDLWPRLRGLVRTLILSLDDVGTEFDQSRGLPGLFQRLETFCGSLIDDPLRPRLLVNLVLSRLNPGALRRVAPVARRWHAGLYFCPMDIGEMHAEGFVARHEQLELSETELREAARLARLLKATGHPLQATDKYLGLLERDPRLQNWSCSFPRMALTVLPDGSFRDCRRRNVPLLNVRELYEADAPLEKLFRLPRYQEMLREAPHCSVCNNPDKLETSWGWQLRPSMMWRSLTLSWR